MARLKHLMSLALAAALTSACETSVTSADGGTAEDANPKYDGAGEVFKPASGVFHHVGNYD